MKRLINLVLILFFISGCGGITLISKDSAKDLYTDRFLEEIGSIKEQYRQGQEEQAFKRLQLMEEQILLPSEKAVRRNLMGVILFSKKDFEKSIFNFDMALSSSRLDLDLTALIYLNLASSYFKLGFSEKSFATLNLCDHRRLKPRESKKYHNLNYRIAKDLGRTSIVLKSLQWYLGDKKKLSDLKSDSYYEELVSLFFKLDRRAKMRILEEFQADKLLVTGYLGYLEVEKLYYKGDRSEAMNLLDWVRKNFDAYPEIDLLVKNFFFRVENYAKMDLNSIGVILPLSGEKGEFGKRALMGIDSGLRQFKKDKKNKKDYQVHIQDSKGSGVVGAYRVRELIERHYVSAIIGGLFSNEATKEYLEARKHGVFFISLSQIYLPKEEKDHLLLEIPGSVESQVNRLFSKEMLDHFGSRAAMVYPNSERGKAFVNEFWRKARQSNVQISGIYKYDKAATDHRDTIKKLLGLKFTRERQEELDLQAEIHSMEENKSTRRIQTLKPQIDFDWAFIPSYPKEALQIIPSFSYFDANKLNLIGGPSWRSETLSKESYKTGQLNFVGDNVQKAEKDFITNFTKVYKRRPRLVELRSHDAFKILDELLSEGSYASRDELDLTIRGKSDLTGVTGRWVQEEGVWIKEMSSLVLKRGKISKLEPKPPEEKAEPTQVESI